MRHIKIILVTMTFCAGCHGIGEPGEECSLPPDGTLWPTHWLSENAVMTVDVMEDGTAIVKDCSSTGEIDDASVDMGSFRWDIVWADDRDGDVSGWVCGHKMLMTLPYVDGEALFTDLSDEGFGCE